MAVCGSELPIVIQHDVYNSQPKEMVVGVQDGFDLQQPDVIASCQADLFNAIETFCSIPGQGQLNIDMCNVNTMPRTPTAFYERLIAGKIQHPDDMFAIWASRTFDASLPTNTEWNTVIENYMHTQLNTNAPQQSFLGFRGVEQETLRDISISNSCEHILLVDSNRAYNIDSDGFLRFIEGVFSPLFDNDAPRVQVSGSGNVQAAMFSDRFFVFVNNQWSQPNASRFVPADEALYGTIRMWEEKTPDASLATSIFLAVLISTVDKWILQIYQFGDVINNPDSVFTPIAEFGQTSTIVGFRFRIGFCVLTSDSQFLICSTFFGVQLGLADNMQVHLIDVRTLTNPPQYDKWVTPTDLELGRFLETSPFLFRTMAYVDGSVTTTLSFFAYFETFFMQFDAQDLNPLVFNYHSEAESESVRLCENLSRTKRIFLEGRVLYVKLPQATPLVISNQNNSFSLGENQPYLFAVSPDGLDIFIFRDAQLFRLQNPSLESYGDRWTSTFTLYFSDFLRISDLGVPSILDSAVYNPNELWYLGTTISSGSFDVVTVFPTEVARAPHQTFRYLVQKPKRGVNPPTFLYATSDLQRANEYVLAQDSAFVKVFNDGNVTMETREIIWTSRTNDQTSSNPERSSLLDLTTLPHAAVSPNGLYLLYATSDRRLRLVNNGFNTARFAQWCALNAERFDNALLYQSNLCWNALKNTGEKDITFKDQRCTCIGGDRLFRIMAPNTQNLPQALLAPVSENLPCVVSGCSESFFEDDQPTNVSSVWAQRCANGRIFSICEEVFDLKEGVDFVNVGKVHLQNCSINNFQSCQFNVECGPGMGCLNGLCTATCKTQQDCQKQTGSGITVNCVKGFCQPHTQPVSSSTFSWVLFAIIIISLIFVALLFAIMVVAAKKRSST